MRRLLSLLVLVLCAALAAGLGFAMWQLPAPGGELAAAVRQEMTASGVEHAVTAVLLNFRGYDTLLEIAVLLLAVLGMLAAMGGDNCESLRLSGSPQPLLQSLARILVPLMVLVAGYLLWAGSKQPGGAFQAGAVLAAAAVLLYLAGLVPAWAAPGALLRAGLAGGLVVFLGVAVAALGQGALLEYPPARAGALILAIESALTVSLGLMLAGLFLWLPDETEEAEE